MPNPSPTALFEHTGGDEHRLSSQLSILLGPGFWTEEDIVDRQIEVIHGRWRGIRARVVDVGLDLWGFATIRTDLDVLNPPDFPIADIELL